MVEKLKQKEEKVHKITDKVEKINFMRGEYFKERVQHGEDYSFIEEVQ